MAAGQVRQVIASSVVGPPACWRCAWVPVIPSHMAVTRSTAVPGTPGRWVGFLPALRPELLLRPLGPPSLSRSAGSGSRMRLALPSVSMRVRAIPLSPVKDEGRRAPFMPGGAWSRYGPLLAKQLLGQPCSVEGPIPLGVARESKDLTFAKAPKVETTVTNLGAAPPTVRHRGSLDSRFSSVAAVPVSNGLPSDRRCPQWMETKDAAADRRDRIEQRASRDAIRLLTGGSPTRATAS